MALLPMQMYDSADTGIRFCAGACRFVLLWAVINLLFMQIFNNFATD